MCQAVGSTTRTFSTAARRRGWLRVSTQTASPPPPDGVRGLGIADGVCSIGSADGVRGTGIADGVRGIGSADGFSGIVLKTGRHASHTKDSATSGIDTII